MTLKHPLAVSFFSFFFCCLFKAMSKHCRLLNLRLSKFNRLLGDLREEPHERLIFFVTEYYNYDDLVLHHGENMTDWDGRSMKNIELAGVKIRKECTKQTKEIHPIMFNNLKVHIWDNNFK